MTDFTAILTALWLYLVSSCASLAAPPPPVPSRTVPAVTVSSPKASPYGMEPRSVHPNPNSDTFNTPRPKLVQFLLKLLAYLLCELKPDFCAASPAPPPNSSTVSNIAPPMMYAAISDSLSGDLNGFLSWLDSVPEPAKTILGALLLPVVLPLYVVLVPLEVILQLIDVVANLLRFLP